MAMSMDRSKYQNPEMPVGYVKPEPELRYTQGIEIDGVHYIWAPYIYDQHIEEREDYATLSDLIMTSDEDEGLVNNEDEGHVNNEDHVVEDTAKDEPNIISPNNIKKEKETVTNKEESEEFGGVKKKSPKCIKKGHDNSDSTVLDTTLAKMEIDCDKHEKHKKVKKSKKDPKINYRSDSSSPPPSRRRRSPLSTRRRGSLSSSRRHEKIVTYSPSPSPSPERYLDIKVKEERYLEIKEESLEQPQHLFGSYHCDVCNITMTSMLTYDTHINGKRHRKNLKLKNVPELVAQSIPATVISEDQSKYPKPPPGVIRRKVNKPAKIQRVIEEKVKVPCPEFTAYCNGKCLNYVTEIQGIKETQYYCSLCDSVCSSSSIMPHLTGFKHSLTSIKQFKPGAYEDMVDKPKYRIEKDINGILRTVQKREGMGRMVVEVEEIVSDSKDMLYNVGQPSRDYRSQPSTSRGTGREPSGMEFSELYEKTSRPNMSASDFFCEICQSHMNALQMWEAHIRGKRHLTNLKKMPGDLPSKTKTVLVPNKKAHLLDRLAAEVPYEPIVGLKEIRETEIPETRSHSYQCFLCGSCHTSMDIVEHVISLKHRMKYLDHINFPGREVTFGMSDNNAYNLVKDMCDQVQADEGPGMPAVHVNKNSLLR